MLCHSPLFPKTTIDSLADLSPFFYPDTFIR